jgi:hypothetical protein
MGVSNGELKLNTEEILKYGGVLGLGDSNVKHTTNIEDRLLQADAQHDVP